MVLSNFLIIGAAKAGTTTVAYALGQHPEVYMSCIKEPNFFALAKQEIRPYGKSVNKKYLDSCIRDIGSYEKLFDSVSAETAIGEASPSYLYFPHSAQAIKEYNPNMKLIVILRNPIDRAYSNFLHHIRDELETTDNFLHAISLEGERIKTNWWWGFHYTKASLYYEQLRRYCDVFPAENLRVYLFEDLVSDSISLVQDVFSFLEIDVGFQPDLSIHQNKTGIPKSKLLNRFLRNHNPAKTLLKPLLPNNLRKQLIANLDKKNLEQPKLSPENSSQLKLLFRDDILNLQDLIQRDLAMWL